MKLNDLLQLEQLYIDIVEIHEDNESHERMIDINLPNLQMLEIRSGDYDAWADGHYTLQHLN